MGDFSRLRNYGVVVGTILLCLFALTTLASSDELRFVVGETRELQITPSLEVRGSPGLKPDRACLCERIHIHGLARFKHIDKYAHSLKLTVNISTGGIISNVDVCFHMKSSRAIGMCPHSRWKKVVKGSWIRTMSPFDHKILDVRIVSSSKVTFKVSAVEELFLYRIAFLIIGAILLALASTLSKSLAFYYSSAMAVGIILVVLLVLFQGMKLLPTGRSSFVLFIYPSLLGVGGFLLRYIPGLFESLLTEMGIDEEIYPVVISVVVISVVAFLSLFGAYPGLWIVRKLILKEDGSIDISTSIFVAWLIRIIAVILILQSSIDRWFAGGALISVIIMTSILKKITILKFPLLRVTEILMNMVVGLWEAIRNVDAPSILGYLHDFMRKSPDASEFGNHAGGINKGKRETPPSESDIYPSTFHKIPERNKLTEEEWKKVTEDTTSKEVHELVSSPEFWKWAAANSERINATPRKERRSTDPPV